MKSSGFGSIGNIIVGISGSFFVGWLGTRLGIGGTQIGGFNLASIVTSFLSAIVLLFIVGLFNGGRTNL
jgi:uncharacterized membrane protein YeaQ/YmgE (transglycosylase-associated protein family)